MSIKSNEMLLCGARMLVDSSSITGLNSGYWGIEASMTDKETNGGLARAAALTAEERKEIASKAAKARWGRDPEAETVEVPKEKEKTMTKTLPDPKPKTDKARILEALDKWWEHQKLMIAYVDKPLAKGVAEIRALIEGL